MIGPGPSIITDRSVSGVSPSAASRAISASSYARIAIAVTAAAQKRARDAREIGIDDDFFELAHAALLDQRPLAQDKPRCTFGMSPGTSASKRDACPFR